MKNTTNTMDVIEMAKEAYIKVMGYEKWISLTIIEKHDAIMGILKGLNIALANMVKQ